MNCDDARRLGKSLVKARAARKGGRTSIGSGGLPLRKNICNQHVGATRGAGYSYDDRVEAYSFWAKTWVKARAAREGGRTSIGSGGLPLCNGLDEDSGSLLAWVLGLAKGGGDV